MDHRIDLVIVGDGWFNRDEVAGKIQDIPASDTVIFSTRHEGVSLRTSGILDFLNIWCAETGKDPDLVFIDSPNQIETLPFKYLYPIHRSHFFSQSMVKYHRQHTDINGAARLFGLFVGRYTPDRNMMVRDMLPYHRHFLFSVLVNNQIDLNNPCTVTYDPEIRNIGSLDGMCVSDQFKPNFNTNASLLEYYDRFQIEIVSETMTRGESFFPTEKTVRPMMGSKPMLIFGTMGFLSNLRSMGFQTFETLWDESYDDHEGSQRWNMMKSVIKAIIQDGYDIDLAQKIVYHNYMVLQDMLRDG